MFIKHSRLSTDIGCLYWASAVWHMQIADRTKYPRTVNNVYKKAIIPVTRKQQVHGVREGVLSVRVEGLVIMASCQSLQSSDMSRANQRDDVHKCWTKYQNYRIYLVFTIQSNFTFRMCRISQYSVFNTFCLSKTD